MGLRDGEAVGGLLLDTVTSLRRCHNGGGLGVTTVAPQMASTPAEQNGSCGFGERSDGQPAGLLHELPTVATVSNPATR